MMANWTQEDLDAYLARRGQVNAAVARYNALTGEQAVQLAKAGMAAKKALNLPMQNTTEASYEAWLSVRRLVGEVKWYAFQPVKFRLATLCTLTPDFMVQYPDGRIDMIDTKGTKGDRPYCREDSRIKIRVAAEQYKLFGWVITWRLKTGVWAEERFT